MKKNFQKTCASLALLVCSFTYGQSYVGHSIDNYNGIHGVILNPSSVVDSRLKTDVNLFSMSIFAGSDYISMDLNSFSGADGFDFESGFKVYPKDDNQFFMNADVLGPSVMFNLSKKSSIGIITRGRAFFNLNNINGTLYENVSGDFNLEEDFDFDMDAFNGTVHAWAELGLTYGRILLDNDRNFLKGGVTVKYLQGAGSTFVNSPSASGQFDADTGLLTTTGNLKYGSSPGFDEADINFEKTTTGFGGDLGLTYEYRPFQASDSIFNGRSRYKLKLGLSITDIGSISYANSTVNSYDLNNTIEAMEFVDNGLETVLEENYESTQTIVESTINLPTAIHLLMDYEVRKHLFVSLQSSLSLVSDSQEEANRIINTVTAAPRFETRWFSFYLPLSLRQHDGLAMGAGLRLGPLTVGSGSLITNYLSDASQTTDVYFGLKVPIYR